MQLSKLEQALLCAARAFAACYQGTELGNPGEGAGQPKKSAPTQTSNGIPVCKIHGKQMRPSKYKEGQYYCGAKLDDETYCREKA